MLVSLLGLGFELWLAMWDLAPYPHCLTIMLQGWPKAGCSTVSSWPGPCQGVAAWLHEPSVRLAVRPWGSRAPSPLCLPGAGREARSEVVPFSKATQSLFCTRRHIASIHLFPFFATFSFFCFLTTLLRLLFYSVNSHFQHAIC